MCSGVFWRGQLSGTGLDIKSSNTLNIGYGELFRSTRPRITPSSLLTDKIIQGQAPPFRIRLGKRSLAKDADLSWKTQVYSDYKNCQLQQF